MDEREQRIKVLREQIKTLPPPIQRAVYIIVGNIDIVDQLIEGEKMTEQEIDEAVQRACKKEDFVMLALLLYKQNKDQAK